MFSLPELLNALDAEAVNELSRRWSVGPRRSSEEQIAAIVEQMMDRASLSDRVATLRESERHVLEELLGEGEGGDDGRVADSIQGARLPSHAAGMLGFVVEITPDGERWLPVIARELEAMLPDRLEAVPAAPEEVTRRRRRSTTSTPPSTSKAHRAQQAAGEPTLPEALPEPRALAREIARTVTIAPASAIVELGSPRDARVASDDRVLGAAVLDVLEETLVVLRASVDVDEWVQRLAVRLEESE